MTDKKTLLCLGSLMGMIIFVVFLYDWLAELLPWRMIAMYGVGGLGVLFIVSLIIKLRRDAKQEKVYRMANEWEKAKREGKV